MGYSISILDIRKELTNTLKRLDENAKAVPHLKAMRIACRVFLDKVEALKRRSEWSAWCNSGVRNTLSFLLWKFYMALGELRSTFGIHNFV